jgi:hypothetical protein
VHPTKYPLLLTCIECRITGIKIDCQLELKRTHGNKSGNDSVKRTLEYYAGVLFASRQGINETVDQWGSRIHSTGIDLMTEARTRIENIDPHAVAGAI